MISNFPHPKSLLLLIFLGLSVTAIAQKIRKVIVVDSLTFEPLPAVLVQVKNTSRALLADPTGIFTITTKRSDTLVLSHVGYKTIMIPLFFEEDAILIRMSEKITLLNEVIVASRKLYPNEINPRKSTPPRAFTLEESIAAPWDYFNKREKEKRKVAKLMLENDKTKTFMEVITDPSVKEELIEDNKISEARYYDVLVNFNQQKFKVIYSTDADAILTALHEFFQKNSH